MQIKSFRDPDGHVIMSQDKVIRKLTSIGQQAMQSFLQCSISHRLIAEKKLVNTHYIDDSTLEHDKIFFPSFPYEWCPEMLQQAGLLTLDIAMEVFNQDFGLKDASPYNILFDGPNPIFVDILSFEKRNPNDFTWLAYSQFTRNFILPLLVNRYFNIPIAELFLKRRDGIDAEEVYKMCGWGRRVSLPFLTYVSLPKWLTRFVKEENKLLYKPSNIKNADKAKFMYKSLLRRLKNQLTSSCYAATGKKSAWSEYVIKNNNYSLEQKKIKNHFVKDVLSQFSYKQVLDIGCNSGEYSVLAARSGAQVIAIDYDSVVIGSLYRQVLSNKIDVLPLVVDITRPTPAIGWRNVEYPSFLERAKGRFDLVLMLAVIHHMMVTERIPLDEIFSLLADLTTKHAVVEYVDFNDSMFQSLLRGRDELFNYYNRTYFEGVCNRYFRIIQATPVEGEKRWLYWLEKRDLY